MTETQVHALVVEDNPVARRGVAELLRRRGFGVSVAQNGEEALQRLADEPPPEVIVLDMLMPIMDGWHFLTKFKRLNLDPLPQIIVMTGSEVIDRDWVNDHDCRGLLRKPIDERQLAQELDRCLTRTEEFPQYQPPN